MSTFRLHHSVLTATIALTVITAWPALLLAQDPTKPAPPRLYILDVSGESLKPLVEIKEYDGQGTPMWSGDGKRIGFDAWRASAGETSAKAHVFTVNPDGGDPRNLGDGAMPTFSPDGQRIAYSRYSPNRGVWTMDVDGGNKQLIDKSGWSARWSPDGNSIAYTKYDEGANIVVWDVKTKDQRTVLQGDHRGRYRTIYWSFCWSPDSKQLCFKGQLPDEAYEVAVANAAGSDKGFQVLLKRRTGNNFSWHRDGRRILFDLPDPMRKYSQLFVLHAEMPGPPKMLRGQPVDRINVAGVWSPNGRQVVFASRIRPRRK